MVEINEHVRISKDQVVKPFPTRILKQHGRTDFSIPTYKSNEIDYKPIIKGAKLYTCFNTTIVTLALGINDCIKEVQTGEIDLLPYL